MLFPKEELMRSTRPVVWATLIVAFLPIAYARSKDAGVATARAAIEEANARFTEAFERGDAKDLLENNVIN
jgi:hypothetical protein